MKCVVIEVKMNFIQITQIAGDKASSVLFLQQRGILHNPRLCNNCALPMTLDLRDKGDRWRCSRRGCRLEVGLKKDTWLLLAIVLPNSCVIFVRVVPGADKY